MQKEKKQEAADYLSQNHRRQVRKKIVGALACLVVLCTIYALIIPGLTLEKKTKCGKEEHVHNENCYTQITSVSKTALVCSSENLNLHTHTDTCLDENGEYSCGYGDFIIHTHDDSCFDENGNLWCTFLENEAHIHTDECYDENSSLICDKLEIFPHEHTADCYDESGDLICGMMQVEEHIHNQDCFQTVEEPVDTETLTCSLLEDENHQHNFLCYGTWELNCMKEEHTHDESCYVQSEDEIEAETGTEDATESEPEAGTEAELKDKTEAEAELELEAGTKDGIESESEEADVSSSNEQSNQKKRLSAKRSVQELETADSDNPVLTADEPAPMADGSSIDFGQYLKEIVMQKKIGNNWVNVTDGKFDKNDTIRFKMNYTLPGYVLSDGSRTISYQLPNALKLTKEESGTVYNDLSEAVGTYKISEQGLVEVTFYENYVNSNKEGNPINGFVAVDAKIDESQIQESDKVDISFSEDLKVTIKIEDPEKDKSDLTVKKMATDPDADGKITYTIEVTSQNGTGSYVQLSDVMENLVGFDGTVTVKNENNEDVTCNIERTNNGFNFNLPSLSSGGKYILTYTAKLPQDVVTSGTAKNTVYVESTKKDGGKLKDSSQVETSYKQTYVTKSGTKNGDKIQWTITVNPGKHDISGWKLQDIFNEAEFTGPVTMTDSEGNSSTITLPYTFGNNSDDTYTITYETSADKPLGQAVIKNRADLTPPSGQGSTSGEIQVNPGDGWQNFNPLSKKAESLTENGNGTATIQWKVTIDAKDGSIPAPWYYQDTLENGQYFTEEQYKSLVSTLESKFNDLSLEYTLTPITKDQMTYGFKVEFIESLEKDTNFEFTYSTTAPLQNGDKELEFKNSANINNKVWSSGSITYRPLVRKFDANKNDASETEHNYYDKVMDENGTLKWGIVVTVPKDYKGGDLTVTEKLPDGVTLQKLTMKPEGFNDGERDIISQKGYVFIYWDDNKKENIQCPVSVEQNGQNVKIHIPEALTENPYFIQNGSKINFSIEAKINDDFNWPIVDGKPVSSFKNQVEVISKDGETHGFGEQTQIITKEDNKPPLKKTHSGVQDNIIPYSITVNPSGKDLMKGSDTLTLVDTVKIDTKYNTPNTTLYLIPGSVQVFRLKSDGSKGEKIDSAEVPYTLKITEEGNQYNPFTYYTMKMTLPDETPLVVEYKYKVNSPDIGVDKPINNSAKLEGVSQGAGEVIDSITVKVQDSIAGAQTDELTIVKVDSSSYSITLSGAKFELYKYNSSTKQYELIKDENNIAKVYTTDSKGKISLKGLTPNTAYYLKEIEPPKDYLKMEQPYYFCVANSDINSYPIEKPEDFVGVEYRGGEIAYIPNEFSTTKIQVNKRWFNKEGKDITETKEGSISFDIYRKESETNPGSGKVNLRWRAYYHGNLLDNLDTKIPDIPVGSTVTVKVKPSELPCTNPPEEVKVNNSDVVMTVDQDTSDFVYTFTINVDTDIQIKSRDYHFQVPNNYAVTITEPQVTEPETGEKINTSPITISRDDDWKWISGELPKAVTSEDGKTVYYTYCIKETDGNKYSAEYENNNGIQSGTITIKNTTTDSEDYTLPETGGSGTTPYTAAGLGIMLTAGVMYTIKSRKGGRRFFRN